MSSTCKNVEYIRNIEKPCLYNTAVSFLKIMNMASVVQKST